MSQGKLVPVLSGPLLGNCEGDFTSLCSRLLGNGLGICELRWLRLNEVESEPRFDGQFELVCVIAAQCVFALEERQKI